MTTKTFTGKTNAKGAFVYTWQIGGNSSPGLSGAEVKVTKSGFDAGFAGSIFTAMSKK